MAEDLTKTLLTAFSHTVTIISINALGYVKVYYSDLFNQIYNAVIVSHLFMNKLES